MANENDEIRSVGPPTVTERGLDVMAFHLHRFLAPWLNAQAVDRVWIIVGFENSEAEAQTYQISSQAAVPVDPHWDFNDVIQTWRRGDGRLRVERPGTDTLSVDVVPLLDDEVDGKQTVVLGFALLPEVGHLAQSTIEAVQRHANEAIQAARRNCIRLFFDEEETFDIKTFLYRMLDHLPEWCGVDGSASLILSNSLDAMNLESARDAEFHVMAERIYHDVREGEVDRLVGMWLHADQRSFLGAAVESQRRSKSVTMHQFARDGDRWNDADEAYGPFHVATREENFVYLIPLVSRDETDQELLGFLQLAYRKPPSAATSTVEVMEILSDKLGRFLRHSPLYTLSARKMWIIGQVRSICEDAIAHDLPATERRDEIIDRVTELIEQHAGVPAFAIGHVERNEKNERILRYELSFGWTDFDAIDLAIDVPPAERRDSGVSALAARLGQPLVLAGRRARDDERRFKNYLFVDEQTGRLVDARSPEGADALKGQGDWAKLSEYYKPARAEAYASVAVPIEFAGEMLGMVACEVDRDTRWYWWSGYGGNLFWELIASDLALAFRILSVEASTN